MLCVCIYLNQSGPLVECAALSPSRCADGVELAGVVQSLCEHWGQAANAGGPHSCSLHRYVADLRA